MLTQTRWPLTYLCERLVELDERLVESVLEGAQLPPDERVVLLAGVHPAHLLLLRQHARLHRLDLLLQLADLLLLAGGKAKGDTGGGSHEHDESQHVCIPNPWTIP